jgi:protein-histidine pros-kinase
LATGLTALLWPRNQYAAFAFYYPAVLLVTRFGNKRAGLFAALLATVVGDYLFIPPRYSLVPTSDSVVSVVAFAAVATAFVLLYDRLQRTKDALQMGEERLRLAVTGARLGSWHWDLRSGELVWSDQCLALFGLPPGTGLLYQQFLAALHSEDRAAVDAAVRHALEAHADYDVEYRTVWPDGTLHWLRAKGRGYYDANERPCRMEGVVIDVTERKRMEAMRLEKLQLESENRHIREADRLKGEFLANMSHELRTPLSAIIGFSEVLIDEKAGPLNATQKDYLTVMLMSGRHLLQLISDVLDLAKIEAGKMTLAPERFRLEGAVAEVAAGLAPLAREKQLAIGQEVSPAVGEVCLDKQRFKQILYNLLSNALKFTNPGGRVTVAVNRREDQTVELKVQDTGIGIRPEDLGRLFVEFQQLDASAASAYPGTGLGLALTRKMAELHGGTVRAESQLGHGSTFTVLLPQPLPEAKRE